MKCPYCCYLQSHVVDSRQSEDGASIRRRRECDGCGRRFTTYERIDMVPLIVVKKDQTRETFDVNKLRNGIVKACEKRPVPLSRIDELASDMGTVIDGDEAVRIGLIDGLGGLSQALDYLHGMIEDNK